jgi:signal transduction histidine kinase
MVGAGGRPENEIMSARTDEKLSVEMAMSRVLSAERDALAQIAACQSRADETLQETRKTVRAMVRRTQQRLSRLHAACDKRTHELVSLMEQDAAADDEYSPRDHGQDALMEAVRIVAAELTTPDSSDAR